MTISIVHRIGLVLPVIVAVGQILLLALRIMVVNVGDLRQKSPRSNPAFQPNSVGWPMSASLFRIE